MSPTARHPRPTTAVPACDDCDDTGTITDPAPDAPRARPPEPCVSCPGRTLPVTPAAAAMLRAWQAWRPAVDDPPHLRALMVALGNAAMAAGLADALDLTPAGRDLLARVEAAERPAYTRAVALIDALNKNAGGAVVNGMLHAAIIAEANAKDATPPRKDPR